MSGVPSSTTVCDTSSSTSGQSQLSPTIRNDDGWEKVKVRKGGQICPEVQAATIKARYKPVKCLEYQPCCCGCLRGSKFRRAIFALALFGFVTNAPSFIADDIELAQAQNRMDTDAASSGLFHAFMVVLGMLVVCRCFCITADLILLFHVKSTRAICVKLLADQFPWPYIYWLCFNSIMIPLHCMQILLTTLLMSTKAATTGPDTKHLPFKLFYSGGVCFQDSSTVDILLTALLIYDIVFLLLKCWFIWIVVVYRYKAGKPRRHSVVSRNGGFRREFKHVGDEIEEEERHEEKSEEADSD